MSKTNQGRSGNKLQSGKKKRQRGSEVVEFGLTLLPMMGFIFLLLDLCWAIWAKSTLQYAVLAGVRYAITGQTLTGLGQDASIKTVVQRNSIGLLAGTSGANKIFIRYYLPNNLTETAFNTSGNLVEVSVEGYSVTPLGPILRSRDPLRMTVRGSDRVQPSGISGPPTR